MPSIVTIPADLKHKKDSKLRFQRFGWKVSICCTFVTHSFKVGPENPEVAPGWTMLPPNPDSQQGTCPWAVWNFWDLYLGQKLKTQECATLRMITGPYSRLFWWLSWCSPGYLGFDPQPSISDVLPPTLKGCLCGRGVLDSGSLRDACTSRVGHQCSMECGSFQQLSVTLDIRTSHKKET